MCRILKWLIFIFRLNMFNFIETMICLYIYYETRKYKCCVLKQYDTATVFNNIKQNIHSKIDIQ